MLLTCAEWAERAIEHLTKSMWGRHIRPTSAASSRSRPDRGIPFRRWWKCSCCDRNRQRPMVSGPLAFRLLVCVQYEKNTRMYIKKRSVEDIRQHLYSIINILMHTVLCYWIWSVYIWLLTLFQIHSVRTTISSANAFAWFHTKFNL